VVGGGSKPLAVLEVIELDDAAVDLLIEGVPLYSPPRVVLDDRIDVGDDGRPLRQAQAPGPQGLEPAPGHGL
jgi:hypothetical protein